MRTRTTLIIAVAAILLVCISVGCSDRTKDVKAKKMRSIVTSDTILSGMMVSLLPKQSLFRRSDTSARAMSRPL